MSITLNSAMSQLIKTSYAGGETNLETVNYSTRNFTRGEETVYEFDYMFSKNSSCYTKNVIKGSLSLFMKDAWKDFQYIGIVTPTWNL